MRVFISILTFALLLSTSAVALANNGFEWTERRHGALGLGDAIQTRDGVAATYPTYWDLIPVNGSLSSNRVYVLVVLSSDFRPLIHLEEYYAFSANSRAASSRTMQGTTGRDPESGLFYSRIEFVPTTDFNTISFGVTSVDTHDPNGNIPTGHYTLRWGMGPAPQSVTPPPAPGPAPVTAGPSWGDRNPAELGIKPVVGIAFPPYGGMLDLYPDGDKLWTPDGRAYYVKSAGGFTTYDRDGNYTGALIKTDEKVDENGRRFWSGYLENAKGEKGGGWWAQW